MTDDAPADGLAWETLDSRVSYTCPGFDIHTDEVRYPDGREGEFDYHDEGESVVVLPQTPDGDVVVIEEWRQAVDRLNRGLPAGGIEDGEDPREAARRELREETGHEAAAFTRLTSVEPVNGFSSAVFHYFLATDCEPTADRDLDDDEAIRVDTTTVEELVADAREDDLRDGRSMLAVLYYRLFVE